MASAVTGGCDKPPTPLEYHSLPSCSCSLSATAVVTSNQLCARCEGFQVQAWVGRSVDPVRRRAHELPRASCDGVFSMPTSRWCFARAGLLCSQSPHSSDLYLVLQTWRLSVLCSLALPAWPPLPCLTTVRLRRRRVLNRSSRPSRRSMQDQRRQAQRLSLLSKSQRVLQPRSDASVQAHPAGTTRS
jgi:hypothetical protein